MAWTALSTGAACGRAGFRTTDRGDGPLQDSIASGWWDVAWSSRRQLMFPNLGLAEDFSDMPVLVKLDAGRIDYGKTRDNGQDLRFVGSDGSSLLSHEIEKWDESGSSYVWVKIPLLHGSSDVDSFWMYYGNPTALTGQNAEDVWGNGYAMVHHLKETSGTHFDSTSNHNDATAVSTTAQGSAPGQIDGADELRKAVPDLLLVQHSASASLASDLTLSAWVKPAAAGLQGYQPVISKGVGGGVIGYWLGMTYDRVAFGYRDAAGTWYEYATAGVLQQDTWYNLAATYEYAAGGSKVSVFLNGVLMNSWGSVGALVEDSEALQLGADSCPNYVDGIVDELRISASARTAGWVYAEHKFSTDSQLQFGVEEGP